MASIIVQVYLISLLITCSLMVNTMRSYVSVALLPVLSRVHSTATCVAPPLDLSWHPSPIQEVNSLSSVEDSTSIYGFIFNSSTDPGGVPYGMYNWCNMPHVRSQEYKKAPAGYKLEYVEVVSISSFQKILQLMILDSTSPQAYTLCFKHIPTRVILMGVQRRSTVLLRGPHTRLSCCRDQLASLYFAI